MEKDSLEKLYESYGKEIYFYIYSICGSRTMAEDLVQETFLKAILSLSESHSNMRAWLYRVAKNLCFNEMKRKKTKVQNEYTETDIVMDEVIRNEQRKRLIKAVNSLGLRQREIIYLQYFGRVKLKEAAKILGITYENARVLSHRAKKELRKYMEEN